MTKAVEEQVLELLEAQRNGNQDARHELFELLYENLHRLAMQSMASEPVGHTLAPTALVHEVFLRLQHSALDCRSRDEFLRLAATVMRRTLVDSARRRRKKREILDTPRFRAEPIDPDPDRWILDLEPALEQLARLDPELLRVVELRFFLNLSVTETAQVLEVSEPTVKRRWRTARAWLEHSMTGGVTHEA